MKTFMLLSLVLILTVAAVAQTPTPTQLRAKALAIYQPRPLYPSLPDGRRPEGKGIFLFHIDPQTGRVRDVAVEKSTGFVILDQAAVEAFRRWRFKPGSRATIKIPLTFTPHGPGGRPQVNIPLNFTGLTRKPSRPNQALQLTADRRVTTLDFYERVLDVTKLGSISVS